MAGPSQILKGTCRCKSGCGPYICTVQYMASVKLLLLRLLHTCLLEHHIWKFHSGISGLCRYDQPRRTTWMWVISSGHCIRDWSSHISEVGRSVKKGRASAMFDEPPAPQLVRDPVLLPVACPKNVMRVVSHHLVLFWLVVLA